MHVFYLQDISSDVCNLEADEAKHCIRVLRLKKGDSICLIDGKGGYCEAIIEDENNRACQLKVVKRSQTTPQQKTHVHIAVTPPKNIARLEWFLEKATETGVSEITPLICSHSERKQINKERLDKILVSAIKQSGNLFKPVINDLIQFSNFVKSIKISSGQRLIAHYSKKNTTLKEIYINNSNTVVLIGPEGDFSEGELKLAEENGFIQVNLSRHRLRTETAALTACQYINFVNE